MEAKDFEFSSEELDEVVRSFEKMYKGLLQNVNDQVKAGIDVNNALQKTLSVLWYTMAKTCGLNSVSQINDILYGATTTEEAHAEEEQAEQQQ